MSDINDKVWEVMEGTLKTYHEMRTNNLITSELLDFRLDICAKMIKIMEPTAFGGDLEKIAKHLLLIFENDYNGIGRDLN